MNPLFTHYLLEKQVSEGCSKATVLTYKSVFNTIEKCPYINCDDFSTWSEMNIRRFLTESFIDRKWTSHAYNRYRKNLKVFCDWLVREGIIKENPVLKIKPRRLEKALPKFLTQKQIDLIFYTVHHLYGWNDFISTRNRTILYFYLYTGIRLSELIHLSISDVDFNESTILIRSWKWNKDRMLPLLRKLEILLPDYLQVRRAYFPRTTTLFPTRFGNFLQPREVYTVIKAIREKLDFHFTPHMFRHSFATELARKNVSIFTISSLLWHSNLDTAKIYTNFCSSAAKITLDWVNLYN